MANCVTLNACTQIFSSACRHSYSPVQQEVDDAHAFDSVLVGGRERVKREQILRVAVADGEERREFAVEGGFFERGERDLHVGLDFMEERMI